MKAPAFQSPFIQTSRAFRLLLASLACPVFALSENPPADPGVEAALAGLPAVVRNHVTLAPAAPASAHDIRADDPLGAAVVLALRMTGDDDVRNRSLHECGLVAVRRGRGATAVEISRHITDYRAGLLMLEAAQVEAAAGRTELALELAEKAARMPVNVKPWQADLIRMHLFVIGTRLEMAAPRLAEWWAAIEDEETLRMATVSVLALKAEKTGVFDLAALKAEQQKFGATKPMPGFVEVGRHLLQQSKSRLTAPDAAEQAKGRALMEAAFQVLSLSQVARAEMLLQEATAFWQAGLEAEAKTIFQEAEKMFGAPHEQVARLHYHLVRLWDMRGKAADMKPLIEKGLPDLRKLEPMYRPFAFAWTAASLRLMGDVEAARELEQEAARDAADNPNPRTGLSGAVEICLCHASTGRELSPEVVPVLSQVLSGNALSK